jgi:hypothetical protein
VLAGIGTVESDNGQSDAPGVHSGANFAGAEGSMQFEPATFAEYAVDADPAVPLSVYDPADAIYAAAAMSQPTSTASCSSRRTQPEATCGGWSQPSGNNSCSTTSPLGCFVEQVSTSVPGKL